MLTCSSKFSLHLANFAAIQHYFFILQLF